MASNDRILVYVAIDFGTTFSGYAFKFRLQDKIFVNSNWGQGVGFQSYKVPTCVLTEGKSDKFVAFGFEAQSMYNNDDDNGSDSDSDEEGNRIKKTKEIQPKVELHYYDEFKMMLKGEKTLNERMKLVSFDGHECLAIDIFAMALDYLRGHLLAEIEKQSETKPKKDEIKWVLTVPAIWSDSAKQFMRKCATKAGIVDSETSDQLLIALEPEAASLYCRRLDLADFQLKENVPGKEPAKQEAKDKTEKQGGLPKDSHYLVVDCGGGTVDVTAHHYKLNEDICELFAASGGGWGGRNVNKKFEEKLDLVVGTNIMEIYKELLPTAYLLEKVKFEKQKRGIEFKNGAPTFNFESGYEFINLCQNKNNKKAIKTIIQGNLKKECMDEKHIEFSNGKLKFSQQALLDIFSPSVQQIKNHVLELLDGDDLKRVKYIYLVGGFSDCSLLQKVMKDEFTNKKIQVILAPYDASLAVVKGAVLFGCNPHAIASRRVRRFYCLARNGLGRGRIMLDPIIKQNQEIYNDDVKHAQIAPHREGNIFKLYHYKLPDGYSKSKLPVKYSNDRDVDVIEINVKDAIGSTCTPDTKLTIYLYFDSTEIHVTARNDKSPSLKPVSVSIDCLAH